MSTEQPKKKPGPQKTGIDLEQVETLAAMGCTLEEISRVVKLSKRTLLRRSEDPKFLDAIESGRAKGRASLRRMQWEAAEAGNVTAQIWLGKQLLGQRSFEKEQKSEDLAPPPLIIQTYSDPTDQSPEQGIPQPSQVPGVGSGP